MNKKPDEILKELKVKFERNFAEWSKLDQEEVSKIFLYARSIATIGQILKGDTCTKHQKRCCEIFDEIFSDIISATYLASCAIDKPANIVLRRVLELGIASIYLWDMPHIMYSWELSDQGLNFSEMIKHIDSAGYKQYVSDETGKPINDEFLRTKPLKKYYGELSDIAHGKITSFESNLPNRFTFNKEDWTSFTYKATEILEILINAYLYRFPVWDKLIEKIPALAKSLKG